MVIKNKIRKLIKGSQCLKKLYRALEDIKNIKNIFMKTSPFTLTGLFNVNIIVEIT